MLKAAETGPARLTLDPGLVAPDYWQGVEFHRTSPGWDGHDCMGFVHGEIIHRKMVDRMYPGGIFRQRRAVAGMAPRDDYKRILDMGCSSGHFTAALADAYPRAKITGVDLSRRMLEHAWRTANVNGWDWDLYQRAAEATGFADTSFDLVASYIILHEMPADAIRATFAEALRLLEPGGDMLMSDVTRYADLDRLAAWKADRSAKFGGEPFWREFASLDLGRSRARGGLRRGPCRRHLSARADRPESEHERGTRAATIRPRSQALLPEQIDNLGRAVIGSHPRNLRADRPAGSDRGRARRARDRHRRGRRDPPARRRLAGAD